MTLPRIPDRTAAPIDNGLDTTARLILARHPHIGLVQLVQRLDLAGHHPTEPEYREIWARYRGSSPTHDINTGRPLR